MDFDKAVCTAVNHNGDSDSTGAVCGNILGAYLGYNAIPQKFKTNLEFHDVLLTLGRQIFTTIARCLNTATIMTGYGLISMFIRRMERGDRL